MNTKKVRCNWDERPAVIEWACKWPGATVWLCTFCYGDWAHRACLAPSVLWPAYVRDVQPGYEALLEQTRKKVLDVHLLHTKQPGDVHVFTTEPKVTKELATVLKKKYGIAMEVTA